MRYLSIFTRILRMLYWKLIFKSFGFKSIMKNPLEIDGPRNISIGNDVIIGYKSWLAAMPLTGNNAKLVIEDGCRIGNFNHIYSTRGIVIRKNVLTADKVYISDNLHGYEDIITPIYLQPIVQKNDVEIGEGSWIGENVCIIGANIGKHSVIGANSVVTKDIPDYCIAVGVPAKIVKRYEFEKQEWIRVQ